MTEEREAQLFEDIGYIRAATESNGRTLVEVKAAQDSHVTACAETYQTKAEMKPYLSGAKFVMTSLGLWVMAKVTGLFDAFGPK